MKYLNLFVCLLIFTSCGSKPEVETRKAIDKAQALLTSGKCQDAIDIMQASGLQTTDPLYVQVYASGFACRSGFSEQIFFAQDIGLIDTDSSLTLFKSVTLLSTSFETAADSDSYKDLLQGINILITSGGGNQSQRNSTYGTRKAGDIGTQALYMLIAQLGKYLHHYGDVDSAGKKGNGSPMCFVAYSDATAITSATALPASNSCQPPLVGNTDLSLAAAELDQTKRRMCEGLMIITNLADILGNISLPDNDSIGNLSEVQGIVSTYIDAFNTSPDPELVSLINMTKQSDCESFVSTSAKFGKLQQMFVGLFENNLE